jgi:membrane-bound ClpP family serine protease
VGGALYVLPRTSLGRRILLEAPSLDEVTAYADEEDFLTKLIGKTGKTLTLLNPGGLVSVDGERLHCESEGMMIDADQNVEILRVKANRLVVRLVSEDSVERQSPEPQIDKADDKPLDFRLPQS